MVLLFLSQVTNLLVNFMKKIVNLKKVFISMHLEIDLRGILMKMELEPKEFIIIKMAIAMKELMTHKEDFYKVLYIIRMEINLLVNFAIRKK